MIAVWIVAVTFTLVGALYSFPKYYKLFTCRSCTIGRILESRSALGTDQKGILPHMSIWWMECGMRAGQDGQPSECSVEIGTIQFTIIRRNHRDLISVAVEFTLTVHWEQCFSLWGSEYF